MSVFNMYACTTIAIYTYITLRVTKDIIHCGCITYLHDLWVTYIYVHDINRTVVVLYYVSLYYGVIRKGVVNYINIC